MNVAADVCATFRNKETKHKLCLLSLFHLSLSLPIYYTHTHIPTQTHTHTHTHTHREIFSLNYIYFVRKLNIMFQFTPVTLSTYLEHLVNLSTLFPTTAYQ